MIFILPQKKEAEEQIKKAEIFINDIEDYISTNILK